MADLFLPSAGPPGAPGTPGAIAFSPPASLHTYGFTACWTPPRTFPSNLTLLPFQIEQANTTARLQFMAWPRPAGVGFVCAVNNGGTAAQRAAFFRAYDQRSKQIAERAFGTPWRVTAVVGIEDSDDYVICLTCQTGTGTFTWSGGTISAGTTEPILIRIGGDCVVQNALKVGGVGSNGAVWMAVNTSGRVFVSGGTVVDLPSSGSATLVSPAQNVSGGNQIEITETNTLGLVRPLSGWTFDGTTKNWSTLVLQSTAAGSVNPNSYNIPIPSSSNYGLLSSADGTMRYVETVNANPPSWPTGPYGWYWSDPAHPSPNQMIGFMQHAQNTVQAGKWAFGHCRLGNWMVSTYTFNVDHNIVPGYDAVIPSGYTAGVAMIVWSSVSGLVERACVAYLGSNVAGQAPFSPRVPSVVSISGGELLAWVGLTVGDAVGGGVTQLKVLFGDGSDELIVPYSTSTGTRNFMLCTQGKSIAAASSGWRVGSVAMN